MNAALAVPMLIASQTRKAPNALALVDEEFSVTYGELEVRSNALSNRLRLLGLGLDPVIGVCIGRSVAHVLSALAIMKAGAAYLPLDPGQPPERLSYILRDAGVEIVLAAGDVLQQEALTGFCVIRVSADGSCDPASPAVSGVPVELADLAYVIYTSGSTGQPKGVEVTHAGLANLTAWHQAAFGVEAADRASHISAVGFDAAVWEVWPYLTAGASVYIAGDSIARDPRALTDWFDAQSITIAFVSSPMAERLLDFDYSPDFALRIMLTGADVLHRYPPASLPFRLYNNYGPTEASVVTTSGLVEPCGSEADLPSIGRPIQNMDVYILNEDGTRQEGAGQGEICIAGVGLARGYRRRPELTAQKFVWIAFDGAPPVRIYRTGDRGLRLSDGRIAFLGRMDDQIKVRGFRIEPREIEVAANAHRDVLESAVIVREFGPGDQHLMAFLVPKVAHTLSVSDIQAFLAARLPAYMVPTKFIELPALPLTSNGKVDRAELRSLEISAGLGVESYVAPRTATEEQLTQIIAPLLKLDRVSIDDDFFKLGGHSLLGTQLIARVQDVFGVRISLRLLFESPTISALATVVERRVIAQLEAPSAGPRPRQLAVAPVTSPIPNRPA